MSIYSENLKHAIDKREDSIAQLSKELQELYSISESRKSQIVQLEESLHNASSELQFNKYLLTLSSLTKQGEFRYLFQSKTTSR